MPTLEFPELADDVVRLRAWRDADADDQLAGLTDPLFVRHSDVPPLDRDKIIRRIAALDRQRMTGSAIYFAIVAAHDDTEVLGEVSLSDLDGGTGRGSVGYWLLGAARGRGAATRAVRLLAGWSFAELGLARLELTCGPDNPGSQRVALRSGFRQEGLLRSHQPFKGGRRDSLIFGLLPNDLAATEP